MKVQGKIFKIFDTQQVSDKFKKRDVVLEYAENPMYPQFVTFQFTQDKTAILDKYTVGQMVEINFNLRGREWISPQGEKKYFNTIEGWRINLVEGASQEPAPQPVTIDVDDLDLEGNGDDVPF